MVSSTSSYNSSSWLGLEESVLLWQLSQFTRWYIIQNHSHLYGWFLGCCAWGTKFYQVKWFMLELLECKRGTPIGSLLELACVSLCWVYNAVCCHQGKIKFGTNWKSGLKGTKVSSSTLECWEVASTGLSISMAKTTVYLLNQWYE